MKKKIKILCLLCLFLLSVGCKKEAEVNVPFVEINVEEMISLMDADKSFILAVVDEKDTSTSSFIDILKTYQKKVANPIYYIDTTNMNFMDQEFASILLNQVIGEVGLYLVEEGRVTNTLEIPSNAVDLKNAISTTFDEIDLTMLYETRDEYFAEGRRLLSEGYLSTSYSSFYHALPKHEAKEAMDNELFSLFGVWESAIQDDKTCTYTGLNILTSSDQLYYRTYKGKCSSFSDDKIEATLYDYYVKDNKIYVKAEKEKEYKVLFTMKSIEKEELVLSSKKTEYKMKKVEG